MDTYVICAPRPILRLGESLSAGAVKNVPALGVGPYYSSAASLDYGAAYVAPVLIP